MKSGELAAELSIGGGRQQRYVVPHCLPPTQHAEAIAAAAHDVAPVPPSRLGGCFPWDHLSRTEPSPGMHVVCILPGGILPGGILPGGIPPKGVEGVEA